MTATRALLTRLGDARSVTHAAASAAAIGGLSLIEPRRLGRSGRRAYRVALAGTTGWLTWAPLGDEPVPAVLGPAARVGLTTGGVGLAVGLGDVCEALDSRLHDRLVRSGVARPRVAMAAGGVLLTLGSWWLGRRAPALGLQVEGWPQEEVVPLPDAVRGLIQRLLAATDGHGAPALRAQLDGAQALVPGGEDLDEFWPGIGLSTGEGLPLAVPGDARFPVVGRCRALGGRSFDVHLLVQDGRLSTLGISEGAGWGVEQQVAWSEAGHGAQELPGWPHPDEVELYVETADGVRPVG